MDSTRFLWNSVCIDFIDTFKMISYKDIPIALFIGLLCTGEIKNELREPNFSKYLKNKISTDNQIQPSYERFLEPIRKKIKSNKNGKIVLNRHMLRFPENILTKYFKPEKTVIIAKSGKKIDYCNIPTIPILSFGDYQEEIKELSEGFIKEAKEIFLFYKDHPVFNNKKFQDRFIKFIPIITALLVKVDNYFEKHPISCVIVGTTKVINEVDILSRILTVVASTKGIPSIWMQHGLIENELANMPVFATKQVVYGYFEKDWYLSRGVSAKCIEILGHPRFDNIFTENHMKKNILQEKLELDPHKKSLLLATQQTQAFQEIYKILLEALSQNSEIEIIIKPHPSEVINDPRHDTLKRYREISSKYQSVKLIDTEIDLYDILPNVDSVATVSSNVGLEALLFNKPLFILGEELNYYNKIGIFRKADPLEMAKLIKQFFLDEELQKDAEIKRKEFLSYAYPGELATEKLLKLIFKLTNSN